MPMAFLFFLNDRRKSTGDVISVVKCISVYIIHVYTNMRTSN